MPVWKFHGCPRCNGDLHLETDEEGVKTEECLQCSYSHEIYRPVNYEQVRKFDLEVRASMNSQR